MVGDIVDGWRLRKRWFWPEQHDQVLRRLLARAARGTKVTYLPGNHDEALRKWIGSTFAGVRILHDVIHHTADGRRLLVIHGDAFDGVCREMKWLALFGSVAYDTSLHLNTWLNALRRWLGLGYWSLSGFLNNQVKTAVKFIDRYERTIIGEARRRGASGVVCGHVHKPEMRTVEGIAYFNDGDWVESCSALVEHWDGRLELVTWAGSRRCDLLTLEPAVLPGPHGYGRRRLMRILLASDAWAPQVNGVVRTLQQVKSECEKLGHHIDVVSPDQFRTLPCPTYPEIRLALRPGREIGRRLDAMRPESVHVATAGPLGIAARRQCLRRGLPFTTSYHTRFPEYVHARFPVPLALGYAWMRWFHRPSAAVMVATRSIRRDLETRGFAHVVEWSRGVDTELFRPDRPPVLELPRPVHLYIGRVAVEKNLEAFLAIPLGAGSKLVVGDGPQLAGLRTRYRQVHFVGAQSGEALARHYASGDVFVFPSLTDTFGLVLLEALAAGLPVAAYPVPGPLDVIGDSGCGVLDPDLARAAERALAIPRARCRMYALTLSWRRCAEQFLGNLHPVAPHAHAPDARRAAAERSGHPVREGPVEGA